jgi:hypothetical protein
MRIDSNQAWESATTSFGKYVTGYRDKNCSAIGLHAGNGIQPHRI